MKNYILLVLVFVGLVGGMVYFSKQKESGQDKSEVENSISPTLSPMAQTSPNTTTETVKNSMHNITLKTNLGDITFETYDVDAPKTVENFITLANRGFYKDVIFHRVIKGFMIQVGDPTGTGSGGPGYQFADELDPTTASAKAGYKRGVVAMANAGPNTNGSQFFIMHQDYPLPHSYNIFGKVTAGQDVVDKIATTPTGPNDRPIKEVVIQSVAVVKK